MECFKSYIKILTANKNTHVHFCVGEKEINLP